MGRWKMTSNGYRESPHWPASSVGFLAGQKRGGGSLRCPYAVLKTAFTIPDYNVDSLQLFDRTSTGMCPLRRCFSPVRAKGSGQALRRHRLPADRHGGWPAQGYAWAHRGPRCPGSAQCPCPPPATASSSTCWFPGSFRLLRSWPPAAQGEYHHIALLCGGNRFRKAGLTVV